MSIEEERKVFSENLRRLLLESGETQNHIAAYVGISPAAVSDYVHGRKIPRVNKAKKIADFFGVKLSDLLERKDQGRSEVQEIYDTLSDEGKALLVQRGRELQRLGYVKSTIEEDKVV